MWYNRSMKYIDMRKVGKEGLKQIHSQVVQLKKMGKKGKEIDEIVGVRQNHISGIWSAYQREGESSLERKKCGRNPGTHILLEAWDKVEIRKAIVKKAPEDFGVLGKLWALGRTREYFRKQYQKNLRSCCISAGTWP